MARSPIAIASLWRPLAAPACACSAGVITVSRLVGSAVADRWPWGPLWPISGRRVQQRTCASLGVGAGQMSRVDSARIASIKAQNAGLTLAGSAVASDAFFPFRDGLDVVVAAGATAVVQPGGSMRDQEVIDAANEHGIIMALTGTRHFRH